MNVTERSFNKALGDVINNAKDWNVRRTKLKVPDAACNEENNKERQDNAEDNEENKIEIEDELYDDNDDDNDF